MHPVQARSWRLQFRLEALRQAIQAGCFSIARCLVTGVARSPLALRLRAQMGYGNTKQVEPAPPEPAPVAFREPGEAAPPPQAPPRTEEQGAAGTAEAERAEAGRTEAER